MKRVLSVKEKTTCRNIGSIKAAYRQGFSRGPALGLILLAAFIVLSGGLLYGQAAVDALFIDEQGNVGIGTNEPMAKLDVRGNMNTQGLEVKGSSNLKGPTTLNNNLTVKGKIHVGDLGV